MEARLSTITHDDLFSVDTTSRAPQKTPPQKNKSTQLVSQHRNSLPSHKTKLLPLDGKRFCASANQGLLFKLKMWDAALQNNQIKSQVERCQIRRSRRPLRDHDQVATKNRILDVYEVLPYHDQFFYFRTKISDFSRDRNILENLRSRRTWWRVGR